MENLERTYKLPSNGIFGGPTEVSIRPMSTKEEKLLYASRDYSFVDKIVKSCIIEPKDIDMRKLHPNDIIFLIFMIRELTFGPTYPQTVVCPTCGTKQEIEINITDMEYYILDLETLEESLTVKLPHRGDIIKLHLLSNGDIEDISKTVKRLEKQGSLSDAETYEYILRFARMIESINEEEYSTKADRETIAYLDELHLEDFDCIKKALASIKIGLNMVIYTNCKKCSDELEVVGTIVPEFFRSTK